MDTRLLPNRDRLTAKEVAAYLGVCLDQVYDLNTRGLLPAVPHGARSWRWRRQDVLAFDTPKAAAAAPTLDVRAFAALLRRAADLLDAEAGTGAGAA